MSTVSGLDIANNVEREWRDRLEAAVKAEREACAQVCDDEIAKWKWDANVAVCAAAIRARGSNAS